MTAAGTDVVVFGATSTIAEAVLRRYAAAGARLHLVARRADRLEVLRQDLHLRGAAAVTITVADLAAVETHADVLTAVAGAMPRPDVVLLAWGTLTDQRRADGDPAYAAAELTTNFTAPAALVLGLLDRALLPAGTVLAAITSVAGDRGRTSNFVYGAAKGGLQRFLEGLRHRLQADGVAVLDIRPGFVVTPMTAAIASESKLWAQPETVARDIVRGILTRRAVLYTPWFWRWIMLLIRTLPRPIFHRLEI